MLSPPFPAKLWRTCAEVSSVLGMLQHKRCFLFTLLYLGLTYNRSTKLGMFGAYGGVDILYLAGSAVIQASVTDIADGRKP